MMQTWDVPTFDVQALAKHFPLRIGLFGWKTAAIRAVQGISFTIPKAKTYALVGESGCGKTTTSRMLLRLEMPTAGHVLWQGRDIWDLRGPELRQFRRAVQAVFQDPWASMNPRMRIGEVIAEPLHLSRRTNRSDANETVAAALTRVGLQDKDAEKYPHEFSGGQRQRIAIARALAAGPELVVLDEPVSALDVSVRAQIMNILRDLQKRDGLSYLLIAHHLATVRYLSHLIGVMYLGRIVEEGDPSQVIDRPLHPYTQMLVAASLSAIPGHRQEGVLVQPEVPSPLSLPPGCEFHPRCPFAMEICKQSSPTLRRLVDGRRVACHLYSEDAIPGQVV